jgi:quinoprotein glucose dehydrogenase
MPGAVASLDRILTTGAVSDQQAVFNTLAKLDGDAVNDILGRWMDKLLTGSVPPELHLDLLEAAAASKSDAVREKVKQFDAKRPADDPTAPFVETLAGGNAKAGRDIFMKRADVSCLRCHMVSGQGGVMGPDMSDVGAKRDRKYLLESIVAPNKHISPGFESAVVKLKNGKAFNGVVKSETDAELVMEIADTGTMKLAKAEVVGRTPAPSPMPENIAQPLSKNDLRDLVEFLATLKPAAPASGG